MEMYLSFGLKARVRFCTSARLELVQNHTLAFNPNDRCIGSVRDQPVCTHSSSASLNRCAWQHALEMKHGDDTLSLGTLGLLHSGEWARRSWCVGYLYWSRWSSSACPVWQASISARTISPSSNKVRHNVTRAPPWIPLWSNQPTGTLR
jgi:hypothetical protein